MAIHSSKNTEKKSHRGRPGIAPPPRRRVDLPRILPRGDRFRGELSRPAALGDRPSYRRFAPSTTTKTTLRRRRRWRRRRRQRGGGLGNTQGKGKRRGARRGKDIDIDNDEGWHGATEERRSTPLRRSDLPGDRTPRGVVGDAGMERRERRRRRRHVVVVLLLLLGETKPPVSATRARRFSSIERSGRFSSRAGSAKKTAMKYAQTPPPTL
mmetsp:Transcript_38357/g.114857  ORF Transcript_38357/g.114857 Transcript_38357/m.114857 type:complete len:211 (+) Transcript_38357:565-1197(+)